MLNDLWKKYIIRIKCEKNIATESSNTPSVIYLCRICSSFRTHDESLVENHLIDRHEIRCEMHSDLCSCDDSNNASRIVLESVLTADNSIFTAIDNKEDHTSEILNTLYCQTSYLSKSPTNVDDSSPVTNDRNSIDSISPPHSPLSPVLRELNSTRKKITVTLNSSPPLPTAALSISELHTPEKPAGISDKGAGSTSFVAYETFLSSSDSPSNAMDSALKHKCPDCDRCFSSYKAFERHTLRSHAPTHHLGEKTVDLDSHLPGGYSTTIAPYEFICPQCDRGFTTNHAYKMHVRVHKSNKKSTRHSDSANTHKCDSLDGNNRKEVVIEPRYRTILPKPCSKQSSVQFSLLDLKPKRRNARRQTSSSSSEQSSLSARQTNHNDDSNNHSIPTTAVGLCNCSSNYISNGNLHIHSNSGNILLQSPASVSANNNNIIYDSMTTTSDSINIPSHLLTVAAAYASQISFNTCDSNDTSQNVSNNSSTPGIQVYPIPWSSDAHSSSLISTESLISDLVVNPSVDNPVTCSSDNQLPAAHTITTTTCDVSFGHESLTSYSYIQLYPVMSSDGTIYYMAGTPVELTQTNNSSHQIDFNNQAATCESSYEYVTTNEICSSKDDINDNTDNNNIRMNSSISCHLSSTDVNSTMQANNLNSCTAYIVNNQNFNCKSNEESDYFSSHYNGMSTTYQPISDKWVTFFGVHA
ncbi:zinc finger isoform 1 [Schistosoma japonicum]|uniref:Zinc finger isoform 1 n=1 Tax=Schistosoma japonicum TaxID=6182 RepID=A0A4Z2DGI6_SCHJA|nr:zinc finger isoform 1 [Schistosoma japonicum]